MRRSAIALLIFIGIPFAMALYGFAESRRMPVVHEADVALPDWPAGAKPVTAVLIGDIHIGNASTGPQRLNAIVARINALRPDVVLIAGDLIYGHDPAMAARMAPDLSRALAGLRPRLGSVAVLGNHDLWTGADAVTQALTAAHTSVLRNDAVAIGPLAIGGIDDQFTGHHDIGRTWTQLKPLPGARIVLNHSPDVDIDLPPGTHLLLAGHSHCGQVRIPFYGAVVAVTRDRERCGIIREGALSIIVTGGLGTSGIPLRLNAPPDLWLLHIGPGRVASVTAR